MKTTSKNLIDPMEIAFEEAKKADQYLKRDLVLPFHTPRRQSGKNPPEPMQTYIAPT